VDRKTGRKIWAFPTRDDIDGSPVIAGEKVVVGSLDGRLYIVDLNDGKELWSYEIGAPLFSSPAVDGGIIVIGSDDGRIYAFGEKT
jgi:outer membrane protein assembly factor BamB